MDLNALRKMARKQREAEEAEDNTAHSDWKHIHGDGIYHL